MSQELLYTSAARGLKPGSRGFCTVIATQGMSAPLTTALESLSAYRHVYLPGDPNAEKNPVVWSHVRLNVAGKACSVLSRVSDYKLDYSQRSNLLAHHVVVQASERPSSGPAWLLGQPDFMQTDWDGEPRLLALGRAVRSGAASPGVCSAWQTATGDAGWAGVLAESFLANPERQVYVVFEPGVDLLPLVAESVNLLPVERRWEVTFSTYFTTLPPGAICNWRCVVAGSPEAIQSRRFAQALRIDLTESLGAAHGGALINVARTGRGAAPPDRPRRDPAEGEWSDDDLLEELELQPVDEDGQYEPPHRDARSYTASSIRADELYGVSAPAASAPVPPPPPPVRDRSTLDALYAARSWRPWVISGMVLLMAGLCIAVWQFRSSLVSGHHPPDNPPMNGVTTNSGRDDTDAEEPSRSGRDYAGMAVSGNAETHRETAGKDNLPARTDAASHGADGTTRETADSDSDPTTPKSRDGEKVSAAEPKVAAGPRFNRAELHRVNGPEEYALYQFSFGEGGKLNVPLSDDKSPTWDLYLPPSFSGTFSRRTLEDGTIELMETVAEGVGSDKKPVLRISRESMAGEVILDMQPMVGAGDGWQAIGWCVLAISGSPIRIFAPTDGKLDWNQATMSDYRFEGPLPSLAEMVPLPEIHAESVVLRVDGVGLFDFHRRGTDGSTETLVSQELDEKLKPTLSFSTNTHVGALHMKFKPAQSGRRRRPTHVSFAVDFPDVKKAAVARLRELGASPMQQDAIAGELQMENDHELKEIEKRTKQELDELKSAKEPDQSKIADKEAELKRVKGFHSQLSDLFHVQRAVKSAEIVEAKLFFEIKISQIAIPARVFFRFPSK